MKWRFRPQIASPPDFYAFERAHWPVPIAWYTPDRDPTLSHDVGNLSAREAAMFVLLLKGRVLP